MKTVKVQFDVPLEWKQALKIVAAKRNVPMYVLLQHAIRALVKDELKSDE